MPNEKKKQGRAAKPPCPKRTQEFYPPANHQSGPFELQAGQNLLALEAQLNSFGRPTSRPQSPSRKPHPKKWKDSSSSQFNGGRFFEHRPNPEEAHMKKQAGSLPTSENTSLAGGNQWTHAGGSDFTNSKMLRKDRNFKPDSRSYQGQSRQYFPPQRGPFKKRNDYHYHEQQRQQPSLVPQHYLMADYFARVDRSKLIGASAFSSFTPDLRETLAQRAKLPKKSGVINVADWFEGLLGDGAWARARAMKQQAITDLEGLVSAFLKERPWELLPFGSFLLQTDDVGSDVDLVLSTHEGTLNHATFFSDFAAFLCEQVQVSSLVKVPEAHVPLLKFKLNGQVQIDLLLCVSAAPRSNLLPLSDFDGPKSANSAQGYLCATKLLDVARQFDLGVVQDPDQGLEQGGVVVFRGVTRILKLFAQRKGIYGANLGYLNGISIQIMTLYVMEMIYQPGHRLSNLDHTLIGVFDDRDQLASIRYQPLGLQIQFVLEKWFEVFKIKLSPPAFCTPTIVLSLWRREAQDKGEPVDPPTSFGAACSIFTPLSPPWNASLGIQSSCFSAIREEICRGSLFLESLRKKRHRRFEQTEKLCMMPFSSFGQLEVEFFEVFFQSQKMPLPGLHRWCLRVRLLSPEPSFVAFFESRVKSLRAVIELNYTAILEKQKTLKRQDQQADSTGCTDDVDPELKNPLNQVYSTRSTGCLESVQLSPVLLARGAEEHTYLISMPFTVISEWHKGKILLACAEFRKNHLPGREEAMEFSLEKS